VSFEVQRGRVPGPTHDGYVRVPFLEGLADLTPHVRFAAGFARWGLVIFPQRGHRFDDGGEEVGGVTALLDLALPPQLAVLVSGGLGQEPDRVFPDLGVFCSSQNEGGFVPGAARPPRTRSSIHRSSASRPAEIRECRLFARFSFAAGSGDAADSPALEARFLAADLAARRASQSETQSG